MSDTYTVNLHCSNCGDIRTYELNKGIRTNKAHCAYCGVLSLSKDMQVGKYKVPVRQGDDDDERD